MESRPAMGGSYTPEDGPQQREAGEVRNAKWRRFILDSRLAPQLFFPTTLNLPRQNLVTEFVVSRVLSSLGGLVCLGLAGAAGYVALSPAKPAPEAPPPPALVVEQPVHDFGVVGQMETLHTEFRLVNRFPIAVTIKELLKGCSCAHAAISPERLEPGQTATLTVVWQTGGRRGKASEVVTVFALPDGEGPVTVQVRLKAQIQPDVRYEPDELRFVRTEAGTTTLQFTPGRMPDVQIRSAHPTVSALQTAVDPATGTVTVRYDPAKLEGDHPGATVMVQTTSPKEPWVSVPVVFTGPR